LIIGNGLLARAFAPVYAQSDAVTLFASGVSNSQETRPEAFAREAGMLEEALAGSHGQFAYFSSCGVASAGDAPSPYMAHKRRMEQRVLAAPGGIVFRLPQVVGSTDNPHTLTNYLHRHIMAGTPFVVWKRAERNLIDVEHVVAVVREILARPVVVDGPVAVAATESLSAEALVHAFEAVLGKRAVYETVDAGSPLPIDNRIAARIASDINIDLGGDYARRVLARYYAGASGHPALP
jgi:hypothetical protein